MKVGVVFDNQHRPETTGFYCRRALARLVDVEHLLPHELSLIPPDLFDLFVFVDDGLDYEIPDGLRPRAAWAIDTHMDLDRAVQRFGDADFVFAAQKNGAAALSERLGRYVEWLPLACDPEIHQPVEVKKDVDLVFVGHPVGERRRALIDQLKARFPNSLFCQALFEEMAAAYSRGRLGFNCGVADDLNMRLFEIPAHGIPLITNDVQDNGLEELFTVGTHILTYRTDDALYGLIDRLLEDDKLRQDTGRAGYEHVLAHHTYLHRMRRLLHVVTSSSAVAPKDSFEQGAVRSAVVEQGAFSKGAFAKAVDYFEFPRPDVQQLVPESAARILDIGCGAGALGSALKQSRPVHVTGIELNPAAAERARQRLDQVFNCPVEQIDATDLQEPFDCIILADVLEHLRDPATTLKQCRRWLNETGSLVISIPNSRHHSVISGLIDGNWTYEKAGAAG